MQLLKHRLVLAVAAAAGLFALPAGALAYTQGDLDPSFGVGGKVTTDLGGVDVIRAIARQPDGKIVAGGISTVGVNSDFGLARYNADGSIDQSFGSGGTVRTDFGATDEIWGVALQPDGTIVAVGRTGPDIALARYNGDGSLDPTFGSGGEVVTNLTPTGIPPGLINDVARGVAVDSAGRIVVAGAGGNDFAVLRYQADGGLDPTFGNGGVAETDFNAGIDRASAITMQSDGDIVAFGRIQHGTTVEFGIARYLPDGSPDVSFGAGGKTTTSVGGGGFAVVEQPDGKLDGLGTGGGDFKLVRYLPNGSLDSGFGSGGIVTTDFGTTTDEGQGLALDADGTIVAVGHAGPPATGSTWALARYLPNGSLDPLFGAGGKVITQWTSGDDEARAVVIQPDGRIVVGGRSDEADFAVARYLSSYRFSGFFAPVENPPASHTANAGAAVPVKFSLSGDQGLGILAAGYPQSQQIDCQTGVPLGPRVRTSAAGHSGLTYDPLTDEYTYVWKTDSAWSDTCRELVVKLDDGTTHVAEFHFS